MALIRPSGLVNTISGAIGGQVFVAGKGAPIVRNRPQRKEQIQKIRTLGTESTATALSNIVRLWRAQTDLVKNSWNNLAKQRPHTNRVGLQRTISGFQLFIQFQMMMVTFSQTIPQALPTLGKIDPPLVFNVFMLAPEYASAQITYVGGKTNRRVCFYAAAPFSTKLTERPPKMTLLGSASAPTQGPTSYGLFTRWQRSMYPVRVGQVVWMQARTWAPGYWPSVFVQGSTLAT